MKWVVFRNHESPKLDATAAELARLNSEIKEASAEFHRRQAFSTSIRNLEDTVECNTEVIEQLQSRLREMKGMLSVIAAYEGFFADQCTQEKRFREEYVREMQRHGPNPKAWVLPLPFVVSEQPKHRRFSQLYPVMKARKSLASTYRKVKSVYFGPWGSANLEAARARLEDLRARIAQFDAEIRELETKKRELLLTETSQASEISLLRVELMRVQSVRSRLKEVTCIYRSIQRQHFDKMVRVHVPIKSPPPGSDLEDLTLRTNATARMRRDEPNGDFTLSDLDYPFKPAPENAMQEKLRIYK